MDFLGEKIQLLFDSKCFEILIIDRLLSGLAQFRFFFYEITSQTDSGGQETCN